ncbi:MAG: hypothetical protein Q8S14_07865 [Algoriphagus sp.]|jgi:uncharacterized protein YcfL|uniref:hypothetical protein n=1 Tax=Algoriphagus sp. TaxID=1872435 RepID=UPI001ED525F1|nr:hypothetical protein [Algoriphagus sp.]MBA4300915.1 hypothetical protein [Cyclobacterium sp.]MDO8968440.1 hypothetical protein [Algoriphagus sp.]MDP2041152.1 hypothetical protein [Algoriphagus sp.]MDP3200783.1 hypothetical protein [Algoriphagus sp.]MDP3471777.1 hypothetical protein [Algoriphagus sp.]
MKKVFAIFAIAGLIATASCGNKTTEEVTVEETVVVEETPVIEEAPADSSAVASDSTAATPAL